MNKKILLVTGAAALTFFASPVVANASSDYPPTSNDPVSVEVLPPADRGGATRVDVDLPAADDPGTAVLPKTGGDDTRILQIGGVTLLVGGALVASTLRRSRRSHTS